MDHNYLNFLGELSVINLYKKNLGYRLVKTETPVNLSVKNGVKIDLHFYDPATQKNQFIEIVNIHLSKENTKDVESIHRLLAVKINEKIEATLIKGNPHIFLIPVLWGQFTEQKAVWNYIKNETPIFLNTIDPVCFMTFTDQDNNRVHKFGTLSSLFVTEPNAVNVYQQNR
jgi:hypothetical protein